MHETKIVFLGTSCSTPTKGRNLSSVALRREGEWILFDCPEGTQRQMMASGVSYMKIQHIFISHFHGDHFLGLPGLLATMSMHGRDYPLFVYGPKGVEAWVKKAIEMSMLRVNFEIKCIEVGKKGAVIEAEGFTVRAFPLKHEVPCYGYVYEENGKAGEFVRAKAEALGIPEGPLWSKLQKGETVKAKTKGGKGGAKMKTFRPEQVMDYSKARTGKKLAIVWDTLPNKSYYSAIKGADVLVHESSFMEKLKSRAIETRHSTAQQAGKTAAETDAKRLFLIHISPRHKDAKKMENEARAEFGDVTVAEDLMEIEL
ncbi:ribonuclease Z [Candidatus Micrarchaeota archaeon]|nr:ribonuclease Z [Candidatus Micrarchaeota archaeon]MBU1939546.1 ribonuclease Z [Candidatus Micrarchaeota archaeon]